MGGRRVGGAAGQRRTTTTNGLTGTRVPITELWWATGSDQLKDRTISRGPYTGTTVYTFREWLFDGPGRPVATPTRHSEKPPASAGGGVTNW
ncbi:hypothetical protein [Streptomyces sp. NPDC093109]|uniref:hypothetical protein n=1 Tax=Streptomyces sp. NPDC093109 TaxID=3154977 RepID=UPI00344CDDFA